MEFKESRISINLALYFSFNTKSLAGCDSNNAEFGATYVESSLFNLESSAACRSRMLAIVKSSNFSLFSSI